MSDSILFGNCPVKRKVSNLDNIRIAPNLQDILKQATPDQIAKIREIAEIIIGKSAA